MTEKDIYLGIGLPIVAVLASLTISLIQVSGIREDMRQMRSEFHNSLADIRKDIQLLTGKVYELMGQK